MDCDILVIGAGIAGASVAATLAAHADVLVIEAEDQPGYHTTGRSAAFYAESYGGPAIRPLTSASKEFYFNTPTEFSDAPLIADRGCLHIFGPKRKERAKALAEDMAKSLNAIRLIDKAEALQRLPILRPEKIAGAIEDPECRDLDVGRIHQGYLSQLKRHGGRVLCNARLHSLKRIKGHWHAHTQAGEIRARILINAAGAWGDTIARMAGTCPVNLSPKRRTIILFRPERQKVNAEWPLALDFDERFYFKPETGRILASPADETAMAPCDVQPDELDIAITVDRIQKVSTLDVPRIENRWAGLRTFAPDRIPVLGPDPDIPDFIWCAGQGGYGIQTAPAIAALTAALTLGQPLPDFLRAAGIRPDTYTPARFRP